MHSYHYFAIALGICLAYFIPFTPTLDNALLALAAITILFLATLLLKIVWIRFFIVGLAIGLVQQLWFNSQLFDNECDKSIYRLQGHIESLVTERQGQYSNSQQFQFRVNSAEPINHKCSYIVSPLANPLVKLTWYENSKVKTKNRQLKPNQSLEIISKLSRPRGFVNPYAFDYENHLITQYIGATGTVKSVKDSHNSRSLMGYLNSLRQLIINKIDNAYIPNNDQKKHQFRAISKAITLGDRSAISIENWNLFKYSGVIHLMVISGLHIGIIAGLFFFLGSLFSRLIALLIYTLPIAKIAFNSHYLAWIISWIATITYTLFSGLSIATCRASIMLSVVVLAKLSGLHIKPYALLMVTAVIVMVTQPFAIFQTGFWLSFGAVAVLMMFFSHRYKPPVMNNQDNNLVNGLINRLGSNIVRTIKNYGLTQWSLLLGFSLFTTYIIGFYNLSNPIINLIMVPFMCLVIIPFNFMLLLLSLLEWTLFDEPYLNYYLNSHGWHLSDILINYFLILLEVSKPYWKIVHIPNTQAFIKVIMIATASLLLLPKQLPFRRLAIFTIALLLLYKPTDNSLRLTQLDVGQGLALVIEYQPKNQDKRVIVYDSGKRFSERFDSGADIVIPYLRRQAINKIDYLIISHGDNDHAGGLKGILNNIPVSQLIASSQSIQDIESESCTNKNSIHHQQLQIHFISPTNTDSKASSNDRSCVVLLQIGHIKMLLTGDISKDVERNLLQPNLRDITVLTAPHHGSNSSSSASFIRHTNPDIVLFSSGYMNHFHHPNKKVVKRYQRYIVKNESLKSQLLNSAQSGAIQLQWSLEHSPYPEAGDVNITEWRHQRYFWWLQ